MKVREVLPGTVNKSRNAKGWSFCILLKTEEGVANDWSESIFTSASEAKQAMRERVAFLRKVHGVNP